MPQLAQKPCARLLPLCAVFTYSLGYPFVKLTELGSAITTALNGPLDMRWQSLQWHTTTLLFCDVAS
ncbi:hypothetical protein ATS76_17810 [Pseudoalteromonas sp. 10-33]|nr:hypothetical protein ATS76_17810 [Pseudoalteromonas sp. 10-33]